VEIEGTGLRVEFLLKTESGYLRDVCKKGLGLGRWSSGLVRGKKGLWQGFVGLV